MRFHIKDNYGWVDILHNARFAPRFSIYVYPVGANGHPPQSGIEASGNGYVNLSALRNQLRREYVRQTRRQLVYRIRPELTRSDILEELTQGRGTRRERLVLGHLD